MYSVVILVIASICGLTSAQVSFVNTGIGPGFAQPFPVFPQFPMPIVPLVQPIVPIASGGGVFSRGTFGSNDGVTTYTAGNPYGGYQYTQVSTQNHPGQGQTVFNSRFNDDDSDGAVQSTSYVGGGTANYGSGYPSQQGSSSFISSSNINGQGYQETVSSINNNGHVETYRHSNGK